MQKPRKIPLEAIIARSDELFNAEQSSAVGEHLRFWLKEAREMGDKSGELSLLNELIGHYRMAHDELRGLESVRQAVSLAEALGVSRTLSAGTIFLNAATALHSFGKVAEALKLYEKCSAIYEEHLAPNDPLRAGLYNNMAAAFMEEGSFKAAENCYLQALDLLKEVQNICDAAVTCLNLAQLYRKQGEDQELVESMVMCAYDCFNAPGKREGYYAHTCRKCAAGFGELGYPEIEKELNLRADEYYAGH